MSKMYIAMVGLPARGKSTVALRLCEGLCSSGITARIFNNGDLRRQWYGKASALPEFYLQENEEGRAAREKIALHNIQSARDFFAGGGSVAILDATNASRSRRELLEHTLTDAPLLFIECVNNDPALIEASVQNKTKLDEFSHHTPDQAMALFMERIRYYERISTPLAEEKCFIRLDTLTNSILDERFSLSIPHYITIRDILVSDWVQDLYLTRHGQSEYNISGRIGGDSSLTAKGRLQARQLASAFQGASVPFIFTSQKKRSLETAAPLLAEHPEARTFALHELDEIDAGICDGMQYEEIATLMPEEYAKRSNDKYYYAYPDGEGYASMRERVARGLRKAIFIAGGRPGIVIIGHQAVNRMILSLFLYRRTEDVPYIFVPQNQYFHIIATHRKKLFEMVPFVKSDEGQPEALPECGK